MASFCCRFSATAAVVVGGGVNVVVQLKASAFYSSHSHI